MDCSFLMIIIFRLCLVFVCLLWNERVNERLPIMIIEMPAIYSVYSILFRAFFFYQLLDWVLRVTFPAFCVCERKRAIENLLKACAVLTIWLISVIGTLLDGGGDGDDWRWLFLRGKAGGAPGGDIGCTFTLHSLLPRFGDILAGKLSVFVHCDRLRTIWRRFRFVFCCCFFFFVIWYSVFEFNACDWRMSQWISLEHDVIKREFPNQT